MPAPSISNLVVGGVLHNICDRAFFKAFVRKKLAEKKAAAVRDLVSLVVIDIVDQVVQEEPIEDSFIPVEETTIPSPSEKVLDFFDRMEDSPEEIESEEVEDECLEEEEPETENFSSSVAGNIGSSIRLNSDNKSEAENSSQEPEVVHISSAEENEDNRIPLVIDEDVVSIIPQLTTESSNNTSAQPKVSASVQTEISTLKEASVQTEIIASDATVQTEMSQTDQASQVEPEGLVAANVPLEVCQISKIATELEKSGTVNLLTVIK